MSTPLYRKLADALARQITSGAYRYGDKLPSIRHIMEERGVSKSTVLEAFVELERRGFVEPKPRVGTFVCYRSPALETPQIRRHQTTARRVPSPHLADGFVTESADSHFVPLGGAVLSPDLVPLDRLRAITKEALSRPGLSFARYDAPAGSARLRVAIAKQLALRGVSVTEDELVITSGCLNAVHLALAANLSAGDVVALESPTYFGFLLLARALGLLVVEVPTSPDEGIDIDALRAVVKKHRPKAVVVTPHFQNPTGASMDEDAKSALIELAEAKGFLIIEDDVYSELPFTSKKPTPLAASGSPQVILCSSVSKYLSPGLRIGWIAPRASLDKALRLKLATTVTSPGLNQMVVAKYLESGDRQRHLRTLRRKLEAQVNQMRNTLARELEENCRATNPGGGFLVWAELPAGIDTMALAEFLRAKRTSILPGGLCAISDRYKNCVRLNCGYPWTKGHDRSIRLIRDFVREHR